MSMRLKKQIYLLLFFVVPIALLTFSCRSIPESKAGSDANALAIKMLRAINYDAWQKKTSAVSWNFRGDHKHFWDKKRGLVQVEWDDYKIQFNKNNMQGIVLRQGKTINDSVEVKELISKANAYFVNDSFWLNPLFHIKSPGTTFKLIKPNVLLVQFSSGGVTPGDTYVFYANKNALVTEMRLWVSIVPFKGMGATFKNYKTYTTGVRNATLYEYLIDIEITDTRMFVNYPTSTSKDIFKNFPYK